MSDCLFCRILHREIPATIVYEDDQVPVSYTHLTLPTNREV